jgi:hypothetical protein
MNDIQELQKRINDLEQQNKSLQESVGRWRRKAQEATPRFEYVSERHERGFHYISVPAEGLPSDEPLHEAQEYIRAHILPKFYPYQYHSCYTSRRFGGWVVTLCTQDTIIDMNSFPSEYG